jgi:urease accessory protein
MVSGDVVPLRFRIERDAACVVATQSSSKIYRSNGQTCVQTVDAVVEDDATLVWLPDPLVCYADSRYEQRQQFDLSPRANLLSLDWLTSGRWARDERWAFESVESRTDVRVDDRRVLRETLRLNDLRDPSMRVGRFHCYAVLTMIGPAFASMAARANDVTNAWPVGREMETLSSVAPVDGGAVVRILGPRVQVVQGLVKQLIEPLAAVIGGDPWARKW